MQSVGLLAAIANAPLLELSKGLVILVAALFRTTHPVQMGAPPIR